MPAFSEIIKIFMAFDRGFSQRVHTRVAARVFMAVMLTIVLIHAVGLRQATAQSLDCKPQCPIMVGGGVGGGATIGMPVYNLLGRGCDGNSTIPPAQFASAILDYMKEIQKCTQFFDCGDSPFERERKVALAFNLAIDLMNNPGAYTNSGENDPCTYNPTDMFPGCSNPSCRTVPAWPEVSCGESSRGLIQAGLAVLGEFNFGMPLSEHGVSLVRVSPRRTPQGEGCVQRENIPVAMQATLPNGCISYNNNYGIDPSTCNGEMRPVDGGYEACGRFIPFDLPGGPPKDTTLWCAGTSPCENPSATYPLTPAQQEPCPCASIANPHNAGSSTCCTPSPCTVPPSDKPPQCPGSPLPPADVCAGNKCVPNAIPNPNDPIQTIDHWTDPNAVYRVPSLPPPPVQQPIIWLGGEAGASFVRSLPNVGAATWPSLSGDGVDLATGHFHERVIDVTVPLPGGAYTYTRAYSSSTFATGSWEGSSGCAVFPELGYGWSSPDFSRIHKYSRSITGTASGQSLVEELALVGTAADQVFYYKRSSTDPSTWLSYGNDQGYITEEGSPVAAYTYNRPGHGSWRYTIHKTSTDGQSIARLDQYVDVNGHVNKYVYKHIGTQSTDSDKLLHTICLHASDVTSDQLALNTALARVDFRYYMPNVSDPQQADNLGRLASITVSRRHPGVNPDYYETNRLQYLYKSSSGNDQFHDDVGQSGDLIQVTKYTRVDAMTRSNSAGVWYPHKVNVMQYRYHTPTPPAATVASTSIQNNCNCLGLTGASHTLKSIIDSDSIEQLAVAHSDASIGGTGADTHVQAIGLRLLRKCDNGPLKGGCPGVAPNTTPNSVASKLVSYGETGNLGEPGANSAKRVYNQSGCGCSCSGGGSAQVKTDYSTIQVADGSRRTRVDRSSTEDTGCDLGTQRSWQPLESSFHFFNSTEAGNSPQMPYLPTAVARRPADMPQGAIEDYVSRYAHHNLNLIETSSPSGNRGSRYDDEAETIVGSRTPSPVHVYSYNSNNYLQAVSLRVDEPDASSAVSATNKLLEISYSQGLRPDLPQTITTYKPQYDDGTSDSSVDSVVNFSYVLEVSKLLKRTAATTDLGAGKYGDQSGLVTRTIEYFNSEGQVKEYVTPDNTVNTYVYDWATGRITTTVVNATTDLSEEVMSAIEPMVPSGQSFKYTAMYDPMGRLRLTESPGPDPEKPVRTLFAYEVRPVDADVTGVTSRQSYSMYAMIPLGGAASLPTTLVWTNAMENAVAVKTITANTGNLTGDASSLLSTLALHTTNSIPKPVVVTPPVINNADVVATTQTSLHVILHDIPASNTLGLRWLTWNLSGQVDLPPFSVPVAMRVGTSYGRPARSRTRPVFVARGG